MNAFRMRRNELQEEKD